MNTQELRKLFERMIQLREQINSKNLVFEGCLDDDKIEDLLKLAKASNLTKEDLVLLIGYATGFDHAAELYY